MIQKYVVVLAMSLFFVGAETAHSVPGCSQTCEAITSFLRRMDIGWERGTGSHSLIVSDWQTRKYRSDSKTDFDAWDRELTFDQEKRFNDGTVRFDQYILAVDGNTVRFNLAGPNTRIRIRRLDANNLAFEFDGYNYFVNRMNHFIYHFRFTDSGALVLEWGAFFDGNMFEQEKAVF